MNMNEEDASLIVSAVKIARFLLETDSDPTDHHAAILSAAFVTLVEAGVIQGDEIAPPTSSGQTP